MSRLPTLLHRRDGVTCEIRTRLHKDHNLAAYHYASRHSRSAQNRTEGTSV